MADSKEPRDTDEPRVLSPAELESLKGGAQPGPAASPAPVPPAPVERDLPK